MSYSNTSSAYDFALFESRQTAVQKEELPAQERKKQTSAAPAAKKRVSAAKRRALAKQRAMLSVLGLLMVAAIASLISVNISNTEITDQLSSQQKKLDSLVEDHDAMMVEFERRMSDVAIEEYVTGLGMQRREGLQTEWVTIPSGDIFEISVDKASMNPIESWYDNLLTYFG